MMKTISLLKLRNHLGSVIDDVRIAGEGVIVLKHQHPIVKIVPLPPKRQMRGSLETYKKWMKKLSKTFPSLGSSSDLLELVGAGDVVPLEGEEELIGNYLEEKYS